MVQVAIVDCLVQMKRVMELRLYLLHVGLFELRVQSRSWVDCEWFVKAWMEIWVY